jgi:hypothetical protein
MNEIAFSTNRLKIEKKIIIKKKEGIYVNLMNVGELVIIFNKKGRN